MESSWEEPLTLCAGVGKVVVPVPAAATEPDEPREGSEDVAGENCEGLWGVWGWNDIMNKVSSRETEAACRARPAAEMSLRYGERALVQANGVMHSYTRDGMPGLESLVLWRWDTAMPAQRNRSRVGERRGEADAFRVFRCRNR